MSVYSIDGNFVNDRADWRQRYVAGHVPTRAEGFPGDSTIYLVKALQRPAIILVTGFIEAASHSDLYADMDTYSHMKGDTDTHTISFGGASLTGCDLQRFLVTGETRAGNRGSATLLVTPVQFVWQKLT